MLRAIWNTIADWLFAGLNIELVRQMEKIMNGFIEPPQKISFLLRIGIWAAERVTGRKMLPARLLAWYPKAAIGSGVLESLVAHQDRKLNAREAVIDVRCSRDIATT